MTFTSATLLVCVLASLPTGLSTAQTPTSSIADKPDYVQVSAPLVLADKTALPAKVLEPGKYSIRIVDRFSDRYIVRVDDSEGNAKVTFIGLHNPDLDALAQRPEGAILWPQTPKGAAVTLRGFSFADGTTLEFAYPKAEAVALAKANSYSVVAIDPESEGRKPDPKLTPEDREVVTLDVEANADRTKTADPSHGGKAFCSRAHVARCRCHAAGKE